MKRTIFSIDVGNEVSGVSVIRDTSIVFVSILENFQIIDKVREFSQYENFLVVIEDVRPFGGRVTMQVIDTAKYIGELVYRLKNEVSVDYRLITRADVKRWVFEAFNTLCIERIDKKIEGLDRMGEKTGRKRYRRKTGELHKASFHYVDDRVVIAAMKEYWDIETPKPGKSNRFGLKSHSWQALACGTYVLATF